MPIQLSRQGIRLRADERSRQPLLDAYTNATPQGWVKASTQFEVALARGGALVDITNLTSVTLQGTPDADRDGARAFAQTVPLADLDNTLTEDTWADGTGQHALFTFSQAEMNLPVGDGGSADYWIVVTALTAGGDQIVCGSGRLTMVDDGVFLSAPPPPLNSGSAVTLGEADSRYLPLAGAAAHLPAGATLHVDATSGSDTTAARGTLAAFATLTAAKAAAQPGDLIRVRPGTYDETDLGKNGVGWDFDAGANVIYTGPSAVGIWDDHAGPLVCKVSGAGVFAWNTTATSTFTGGGTVNINHAGSDVNIEARAITTNYGGGSPGGGALQHNNGILRIRAALIQNSNSTGTSPAAIWWSQGELHVDALRIVGGKYGLYTNALAQVTPNQAVWIRTNYLQCRIIQWQGDATAQLWLDALEIDLSASGGQLNLLGGKAYVNAQKVFVNFSGAGYLPPDAGSAGVAASNAWLWIMKLTQLGTSAALVAEGCVGQIDQIEDAGGGSRALLYTASGVNDLAVQKMVVTNPNGVGVEHGGGTLRLRGASIDATAATAGNPVKAGAPGLTLAGVALVAAAGRDSVAAAAAQSVQVVGALAANRPVSGNVTLDVSQNLPASVSVTDINGHSGSVTGAQAVAGADISVNSITLPNGTTIYSSELIQMGPRVYASNLGVGLSGIYFSSTGGPNDKDLSLSRAADGTLAVGGGTAGDASGSVRLTNTTLLPQSGAPAAPASGVTLYVDAAGDLHALHSGGTDRVLSAH